MNVNTFGNSNPASPIYAGYIGDLYYKYTAGGIGTYTRPSGGTTWTKQ